MVPFVVTDSCLFGPPSVAQQDPLSFPSLCVPGKPWICYCFTEVCVGDQLCTKEELYSKLYKYFRG
jgi:hypothetical protein